jgi:hypothetical protein
MEKKKEMLDSIDKGVCQRTTAVLFGVAKSTVGNNNRNRGAILKASEDNCSNERKSKVRRSDNKNVNAVTLQFFLKCRAMNIPVTGPMLQAKARETAQRIHVENLQASNGWLSPFRTRHINIRTLSDESAASEDWKSKPHQAINEYPPSDQLNAEKRGDRFVDKCQEKVSSRKGKNVKLGNYRRKDEVSLLLQCHWLKLKASSHRQC